MPVACTRRRRLTPLLSALLAVGTCTVHATPAKQAAVVDPAKEVPTQATAAADLGVPFDRYTTADGLGRSITFYLSSAPSSTPDAADRLPLILWIQGSGCDSLFQRHPSGKIGGGIQMLLVKQLTARARIMCVEKPGVEFLDVSRQPGSCEGCSEVFIRNYRADRWAVALTAALRAALTLEGIDPAKVLVAGHSEGADMAAKVACEMGSTVTHVGLLAGAGGTQLFDMAQIARQPRSPNETDEEREARVEDVYRQFELIQQNPDSTTDHWLGHPYARWSTFFAVSPIADLQKTSARVFLACGTADQSVAIESMDMLRAELAAAGRDVTMMRIAGANHGFQKTGEEGFAGFDSVIGALVMWFDE